MLLLGHARFIDDLKIPECLHAMVLRSPYAHAKLLNIDKTAALKHEGVIAVLDSRDIEGKYLAIPMVGENIKPCIQYALAKDKVRYVGEAVAVVVARERYIAEDALELIEVKYEPLESCTDTEEALDTSTILHEEWGSNIGIHQVSEKGDVRGAFEKADFIFHDKIRMHRQTATAIETRGILTNYDPVTKRLDVWCNNMLPHLYRSALATALKLDESLIHITAVNIGGSYGTKTLGYQEDALIPLLSIILERPVKWIELREESFKSIVHGREQVHQIDVAVRKDGLILGVRDKIIVNVGAYISRTAPTEVFNSAALIPGCYAFENYSYDLYGVVTNKTLMGPYRGFGKAAPAYVIESLIDKIARNLSLDPTEMRFRNFVKHFPHKNPAGATYDSGNYVESLQRLLKLADYDKLRRLQSEKRKNGEYIGIGISSTIAPTGVSAKNSTTSPYDVATVRVGRDGKLVVITGACGLVGTGHETTVSQVVAEALGVDASIVAVFEGDTQIAPIGQGTFGDRCGVYTLSAAKIATEKLKQKIFTIASNILATRNDDLEIQNGIITSRTSGKCLTIKDVAKEVFLRPFALPPGMEAGLESTHYFSLRDFDFYPTVSGYLYYPCFSNDSNLAVVRVDDLSGRIEVLGYYSVNDCGKVINSMIVEGQIHGGAIAGIGGAIYEELAYNSDGQLLATSFLDYLIPTSMETPTEFLTDSIETPSPMTALGTKGVGESSIIGVYAAVANAVSDALHSFKVESLELPLSPEKVRTAIAKASV